MMRRLTIALGVTALFLAACTTSDETTTTAPDETTAAPDETTAAPEETTAAADGEAATPATTPAEVVFAAQESDGASIVVASVTLPADGYIAVHGNADGSPGPVVGHSELLPAGTSTDVVVTLDTPLAATDLLFPMAHIDMDQDGVYTFFPPDDVIDIPATTSAGDVAVVGAEVTVGG
jgi:S-layer glycoprotein